MDPAALPGGAPPHGNNNNNVLGDRMTNIVLELIEKLIEDHDVFATSRDILRTLHNKVRTEKLGVPAFPSFANGGPEVPRVLAPYQAAYINPLMAKIDEEIAPMNDVEKADYVELVRRIFQGTEGRAVSAVSHALCLR